MGALEFCRQYKQKIQLDEEIQVKKSVKEEYKITMYVQSASNYMAGPFTPQLLELDDSDLDYLYKKYKEKAREDLELKLEQFKLDYADI